MKAFGELYNEILQKLIANGLTKPSAESLIDEMLDAACVEWRKMN